MTNSKGDRKATFVSWCHYGITSPRRQICILSILRLTCDKISPLSISSLNCYSFSWRIMLKCKLLTILYFICRWHFVSCFQSSRAWGLFRRTSLKRGLHYNKNVSRELKNHESNFYRAVSKNASFIRLSDFSQKL